MSGVNSIQMIPECEVEFLEISCEPSVTLLMDRMMEDEDERMELFEDEDSEYNEAGFLGAFR
ncbi:uncharacterized protein PGTG_20886 [Puccinia graminis f. sp. tritici CRL 75-36-700-3]|uniref:Uncharacterized protein n=1 Tax=Puccinia graminis f. sp. tritici (strain CRL 75-36-700-3 / race SCCL) TaxID=418459 RepID=H6QPF6_PUCGT|nr:uncharacterized protein PGTG_20886 [Puccinia graminis f. sp. tritici CRL 75-36-700-3]EHS63904.1 hypothetical protein PGTG_20886 [Puccinia graminis f. sp. tritici CRL 75-36-700-3]